MKIKSKILIFYIRKYNLNIKDLADILRLYPSIVENMLNDYIIELDEEQTRNFIQCFGVADSVAMMYNPSKEVIEIASKC